MDCRPLKIIVFKNAVKKVFKKEIGSIPAGCTGGIGDSALREALTLPRAFRAGGTVKIVAEHLAARA